MLDRIVVNVIHVMPPIFLVFKQMFPVTSLPQSLFLARIERAFQSDGNEPFDLPPPFRKIMVTFRQLPDAVQMVGQNDYGFYDKRAVFHDAAKGLLQSLYCCVFG